MTKKKHETKMLDELEDGPRPSFVTGLKRHANDAGTAPGEMMNDLLGRLEHSYETRRGYWKGGTVGVYGYGGGVILRETFQRPHQAYFPQAGDRQSAEQSAALARG